MQHLDANCQQQDVLIGFRNLFGDHTGANQSRIIANIINEYNLRPKFSCYVADNATNNDSETLNNLGDLIDMDLTEEHRIRCAAHIIQIIVKAVIYGRGLSKFELSLSQAAPQEQFEMFRQQGVVGRLHNFVNAVLASHKRREAFMTIQKDLNDDDPLWAFSTLNLVQNGGVRWHSVYRMLLRCLELKDSINLFIRKRGGSTVDSYLPGSSALSEPISEDEWDEAQHLADFLREFYEMTKRIEGGGAQGSL